LLEQVAKQRGLGGIGTRGTTSTLLRAGLPSPYHDDWAWARDAYRNR
jgi:hypothetical protein